jgi:hypothetical protein
MSERREPPTLVQYEEAGELIKTVADEHLRAFINYGLTTVLVRRGMTPGIAPQADFDLRFFAEALRAMGVNRAALLRILEGKSADMSWWPDDEK